MLGWLRSHGINPDAELAKDSLTISVEHWVATKPRGHGPDPLAEAYPLGRDVVEAIEWRGRAVAPDLIDRLRARLRKEDP